MKKFKSLFRLGLLLLPSLVLSAAAHAATPPTVNWPNPGGALDESNYSPLDRINTRNISKLGLAWAMDLPGERTLEATPLAVDGVRSEERRVGAGSVRTFISGGERD